MLRLSGRKVVVVGGGAVAVRRVAALRQAGAEVFVIAPDVEPAIRRSGAEIVEREYQTGDVTGAALVVIATADATVNQRIADDARGTGAMVNRADLPEDGEVLIPAHDHVGPITLAVSTSGISAAAAAAIRDELLASLDRRWIELLETIAPYRAEARRRIADPQRRLEALKRMTNADARRLLDERGAVALAEHCDDIIRQAGGN